MGTTIGPIVSASFLREMEIAISNLDAASFNRVNSPVILFPVLFSGGSVTCLFS